MLHNMILSLLIALAEANPLLKRQAAASMMSSMSASVMPSATSMPAASMTASSMPGVVTSMVASSMAAGSSPMNLLGSGTDYFPVSDPYYEGPFATGAAPFLAQTNTVAGAAGLAFTTGSSTISYQASDPLVTTEAISNNTDNINIFEYLGNTSPYFESDGFGANEYPIPEQCSIQQVHYLHRHGARYPTSGDATVKFSQALKNATNATFTGPLDFLNDFTYKLGAEEMVPIGRQELYDSGVSAFYQYSALFNHSTAGNIVARTTSELRMRQTAENFLAGYFGLDWQSYADLEIMIEQNGFNNSLAAYYACPNSNTKALGSIGSRNAAIWSSIYLQNATSRLQQYTTGFNWTAAYASAAQELCAYETVSLGYSSFCSIFNAEEWKAFEYALDIGFEQGTSFGSPSGRAQGIGWVNEFIDRLTHTMPNATGIPSDGSNHTLDSSPLYFPLNQTMYLDFTHDAVISSAITALGLTQFSQDLPPTGPPADQQYVLSKLVPFGARFIIEIINCNETVNANMTSMSSNRTFTPSAQNVTYMHMSLNRRTIPMGRSIPACGNRTDGWCTLQTFLDYESNRNELAAHDYNCNANYSVPMFYNITTGSGVGIMNMTMNATM